MKPHFVLLLLSFFWSMALAAQVPGPRDQLTFKNVGLYHCFDYGMSAESPFDFIVVPAEGPFEGGDNTKWNERFKEARKNGKRVIVNLNPQVKIGDGKFTNISLLPPNADDAALDALIRVIGEFFAQVDINEVYAVTLSEEQVFWNGQDANLSRLYEKMKAKYDVPVYQWFSPSSTGSPPGIVYPNIKSDGWVADEYFLDHPQMEQVMRAYIIQQKPVIQTIWAGGPRASVPFVLSRFWHQVEVCRKYDIPTEYFTHEGEGPAWGMSENAPANLKHIFGLTTQVAARAKSQQQCNQQAWDFVPWEIPTIKLTFASKDATTATYREPFVVDRSVRFINDAEITGFANLRWDSSPVELRPRQAGKAEASIAYSFECPMGISELRVTSPGFVKPDRDAVVTVSVLDARGKTAKTAKLTSEGTLTLKVSGAELGGQQFKVVYYMSGTAAAAGEVLAGIKSVDVEADVELPKEKFVEIKDVDAYGGVFYREDLTAMSIYHTAEIKNVNDIIPTTAGLHNHSPSRAVEVIQKFHTPEKVKLTSLRVSGNADEPGRSARLGIGVSLDGVNLLAKKMSAGAFSGDVELSVSDLTEQLPSDQFYVHVFLEGLYGVVTSYSVKGNVVK